MGRVIVVDVIETLLDLGALDEHFERVFHDATPMSRTVSGVSARPACGSSH